ncbi:hypothetical protein ACA910_000353 [Epithemia clementina (nom. ined.)]
MTNRSQDDAASLEAPGAEVYVMASVEDEMKPRRALTAYNFFFQAERQRLLDEVNQKQDTAGSGKRKLGFAGLARHISTKWKSLDAADRLPYEEMATEEKNRYNREKKEWKKVKKERTKSLKNKEKESRTSSSKSPPRKSTLLDSYVQNVKPLTLAFSPPCSAPKPTPPQIPATSCSTAPVQEHISLESILNDAVGIGARCDEPRLLDDEMLCSHMDMEPLDTFAPMNGATSLGAASSFLPNGHRYNAGGDNDSETLEDIETTNLVSLQMQHRPTFSPSFHQDYQAIQNLAKTLGDDCVQYVINCFQHHDNHSTLQAPLQASTSTVSNRSMPYSSLPSSQLTSAQCNGSNSYMPNFTFPGASRSGFSS